MCFFQLVYCLPDAGFMGNQGGAKCVQIIFRFAAAAIASGVFQQFIFVGGDHNRAESIHLVLPQHFK